MANADRITQLRNLAQKELDTIATEKAQETTQQSQAELEIHRYAKMSSYDRKQRQSHPDPSQGETSGDLGMKTRFKPFNEILHRLRWDEKFDIDEYVVGYLERFEGIKEMPATSWIRDFSDEEWIPMHRVRYVKRVRPEAEVVWDRDARLDRISKSDDLMSVDGTSVTGGVDL